MTIRTSHKLYILYSHIIYSISTYKLIYLCFIITDIRSIKWWDYDNIVEVTSPTIEESEYVISTLKREQEKGKDWHIRLSSSSLESTQLIIENLNKCIVRQLDISYAPLDSKLVSMLSEALKTNTSMKQLYLRSSPITEGIKQISDALLINTVLEVLWLDTVTGITDDDMNHLSNMLASNRSLKVLRLINCNITDNGVRYICEGLTKNQTLTILNIRGNPQITSVSTSAIAELLSKTTSLTRLTLQYTSLNDDDIKTICTALTKNTTVEKVELSKQHEEYCKMLDSRLVFL